MHSIIYGVHWLANAKIMISKFKASSIIHYLFFSVFFLNGCVSLDSSAKQDEVAQMRSSVSQDIINLKHEINSLKGRLDELQYKIDKISQLQSQQSNELNATLKQWRKETQNDAQKTISDIETNLQLLEKKQAQDIKGLGEKDKIIIEEVSKENTELRRQIESLRKTSSYVREEGYYTVNEGDTLSKIAQMSGISLKSLMEANGITDPNSIRKGQKLIIPQKK